MRINRLNVFLLVIATAAVSLAVAPAYGQRESGAQRWLRRLGRFRLTDDNVRNSAEVQGAFRDVVSPAASSTVRVLDNGFQVALGTVVRSDGYVLTKASELSDDVECFLSGGQRVEAQLVAVHDATDLALLKVEAKDLEPVEWSESPEPPVGSWLASVGLGDTPAAIGVVSVPSREVSPPRAVLGVLLEDSSEGPQIGRVLPKSPAAKSGLQAGDVILRVDGQKLADREALISAIGSRKPGESIELSVQRDAKKLSIKATLARYSHLGNPDQAQLMDSLAGPLSKRRSGFSSVIQHDSVIRPRDCGGPLVDLDAKAVGVNIARASRVASYALPASEVRKALAELLPADDNQVARDEPGEADSEEP